MILMTHHCEQLPLRRRRGFHDGMRTDERDAKSVDTFISYRTSNHDDWNQIQLEFLR
jgi:hypothetical protein